MSHTAQIFPLQPFGRRDANNPFHYVVITPEPVNKDVVSAAWAYAVRYTAKGIDLPDHDKALELLAERHPSWTILESLVVNTPVNLNYAESDEPEV